MSRARKRSVHRDAEARLKPGHALVKTMLVSLCGSDVHMVYLSRPTLPLPARHVRPRFGVVEAIEPPGACAGRHRADPPYHQAMAEYYLAPVEHVLVLPKGKPLDQLLMAQQLGTVIYACQRLPNLIGKRVAVIGLGRRVSFSPPCAADWAPNRPLRWTSTTAGVTTDFGATDAMNNARSIH